MTGFVPRVCSAAKLFCTNSDERSSTSREKKALGIDLVSGVARLGLGAQIDLGLEIPGLLRQAARCDLDRRKHALRRVADEQAAISVAMQRSGTTDAPG